MAQAAVVKAQRRPQQTQPGLVFGRNRRDVQLRRRRDALHDLGGFQHRWQWQSRQPAQQRGFMQRKGRLRNRRGLDQQQQVLGRHARHFYRPAQPGAGMQVQRRHVGKALGPIRCIAQLGLQGPMWLCCVGGRDFAPAPADCFGGSQGQGLHEHALFKASEQSARRRRKLQRQQAD